MLSFYVFKTFSTRMKSYDTAEKYLVLHVVYASHTVHLVDIATIFQCISNYEKSVTRVYIVRQVYLIIQFSKSVYTT